MTNFHEKIEAIQIWLNEPQSSDPVALHRKEAVLGEVLDLIHTTTAQASLEQGLSENYDDLEKQVEEQTAALTQATNALKSQIMERQTAVRKLRKAYKDLEAHLQEHIAYQSRLNQHLQEKIEEQRRNREREQAERVLTEALRDTLSNMSRTLDLDKILDHILETVKRVTPYDGANILLVESDVVRIARQKGYLTGDREKELPDQRIPLTKLAILQQLIDIGKPLATPDTSTSPMWIGFPNLDWVSSNVIAPIRSNGKVLGFLSLDSATPGYFTQEHADRLQGFADQAAIAIQNARLLDRAKHSAVMAERNRLANELHDTISQTLWSISLISDRLPDIWEVNQEEWRNGLLTLQQLAQNALAEMRSLLLELHPSTLTNAKLGELITQTAEIITNRSGLDIAIQIEQQDPIPSDVHFALYRVVQEALNNIVLHALASHVEIYYNSHDGRLDLTIQDNGIGFDPSNVDIGHLGLQIMRDRVQNIGGSLETISHKDGGTLIKVRWIAPVDGSE